MRPRVLDPAGLAGRRVAVVNWRDLGHRLAGGSEVYAWEYARALRDAGAQVDFVTARDRGQSRRERTEGIEIIRRGGVFTFYLAAAWYYLTHRRSLAAVIDPECGIPTFAPIFVRRSTPVVLVVHHVHQEQFLTYFPKPLALVGRFLERRVMPLVYRRALTVAVSESTRAEMRSQLGWTRPVALLPNGSVEPDHAVDGAAKDPHRLVVLGRLVPHKRVDLVIRAVAALREAHADLSLDIVGRGPEEESLRALVAELALHDAVTLHGFLSEHDKAEVLRSAALHVCGSDVEGWGQVVIEAAAHGTPTLSRDVPGLRDSIRSGETGWLVPDSDDLDVVLARLTDHLGSALTTVSDPAVRRTLTTACLDWAALFSWSAMHRSAVELLVTGRVAAESAVAAGMVPTQRLAQGLGERVAAPTRRGRAA